MQAFWTQILTLDPPWSIVAQIAIYFVVAWIVHRVGRVVARRMLARPKTENRWFNRYRDERTETLQRIIANLISFLVFLLATIFSLNLLVPAENLLWIIGLFAGAFGLGLMPLVRDFFTGITYLFEDPFSVGEKVELNVPQPVEGVVEYVGLRTTQLRAVTGEIFTVPNGEVRVIRNFSRGAFSMADVTIEVTAKDVTEAVDLLDGLSAEAMTLLPNLLEPWKVISPTGHIGRTVQLQLIAKARFGHAADLRPRLLALVQERLEAANIASP